MIKIEKIDDIEDQSLSFYNDLQILLEAVYNWRNPPEHLEEYFQHVNHYLRGLDYTKSQVESILKKRLLLLDVWELESISILITLLNKRETLSEMYQRILVQLSMIK